MCPLQVATLNLFSGLVDHFLQRVPASRQDVQAVREDNATNSPSFHLPLLRQGQSSANGLLLLSSVFPTAVSVLASAQAKQCGAEAIFTSPPPPPSASYLPVQLELSPTCSVHTPTETFPASRSGSCCTNGPRCSECDFLCSSLLSPTMLGSCSHPAM